MHKGDAMNGVFSPAERIAIAELVKFAEMLDTSKNPVTLAIADLARERAVNIVKGDAHPLIFSDSEVTEFALMVDIPSRRES